MAVTIATAANYWISPTALSITLNALGEANRIQASVASGAAIICYIRGVDGLGYDNGHNYRRWPLVIAPTYFNTNDEVYLYVAIPRSKSIGTDALVVFPTKKLDIYGYEVITDPDTGEEQQGTRYGTDDYYYIWLQGIITSSGTGYTPREWREPMQTGTLATDEAIDSQEGTWYRWDPVSQTVTFLKEIIMEPASWFRNLIAHSFTLGGKTLNGVAVKGETPADSDDTIVTPAYLEGIGDDKYLRKDQDDSTPYSLGVGGNLSVQGIFDAIEAKIDKMRSHNYSGSGLGDTGWLLSSDDGTGASILEIDKLLVRMKATFMELEIRKETFSGGNNHYSPAGSVIYRVDYMTADNQPLGYRVQKVPWLLKGIGWLFRMKSYTRQRRIRYAQTIDQLTPEERSQLAKFRCYLISDDGTTATRNWWQVGDQPRCQSFNKALSRDNKRNNIYDTTTAGVTDPTSPISSDFWWRLVTEVGTQLLDDDKVYDFIEMPYEHYADYEDEYRRNPDNFCAAGSDIPKAGDTIVCMGNRTDPARMNLVSIISVATDYSDAPAVKGYRGIHRFSFDGCLVFNISPAKVSIRSKSFEFLADNGDAFPVPLERGEWQLGLRYHWYDRVSHNGSIWLCQISDTRIWVNQAGNNIGTPATTDIIEGEGEFTYTAGAAQIPSLDSDEVITGTDHYYRRGTVGSQTVYEVQAWTYDEPRDSNAHWLKEVSKGTEITDSIIRYNASLSGTVNPDEDPTGATHPSGWKTTIEATGIKAGQYLWTRRTTYYSDNRTPTVEYSVARWGIDGDGISEIDSYYWATTEPVTMTPAYDAEHILPWDASASQTAKRGMWAPTFSDLETAWGGIGKMQAMYVWEKTLIKYDMAPNPDGSAVTKPDLVSYQCNRIGNDGLIGQEEYYMLAASDDFATVFGSTTPSYDKIGIRWYKQSAPAEENYRLSSTKPNICTKASEQQSSATPIWSPLMPAYDKATHGAKIYLWNFEQRVDGTGTQYATRPVCIGNHARGIKGVRELYACSAYGVPQTGRQFPNDIYDASAQHKESDINVWTDEIYNRAPSEAYPYQWNWTRTLYSSPRDASDTARDSATGYFYEDVFHVSAVRGTNGEDGAGEETIYKRNNNGTTPATPPNSGKGTLGGVQKDNWTADEVAAGDDWVPDGWTDNPLGIDYSNQYEFESKRKLGTADAQGRKLWGALSAPKLRSKWGRNGQDGDGTEYVFIRTKNNVAPTFAVNDGGNDTDYKSQEWLPYINNKGTGSGQADAESNRCTDDPKGTDETWLYEWAAKRTMADPDAQTGVRLWKSYYECMDNHTMAKWSNHAKSITKVSETYRYATNNTGVRPAASSSDWSTTKPTLEKGYWLYTETTITWSDGSKTVLYTDERNPNDGIAGQDIIVDGATVMKYYVGDSNITHPADTSSDWKDLSQVTQTQGKWLWSQAKTNYKKATDGSSAGSTYNYNVSYIAKDGPTGRAVKSMTEYYKATQSSSAMSRPTSTSGWDTDPNLSHLTNKWSETYKYLWNMEKVVYTESDGSETTEYTIPQMLAIWTKDGDAGRGIDSIVNKYKVTNSTTPPKREHEGGTGWDNDPTAPGQGEYLWNYEIITWTKGTTTTYTEVQMIGYAGEDGNGIVSITNTFGISAYGTTTNDTTAPSDISSWSTSQVEPTTAKPFIWKKEVTVFTDTTKNTTKYFCIGKKGDKGDSITGSPGHVGRFFYYAGEYNANTEYKFEKTQAPYVLYQGNFYMMDYAANADYQQSSTTRTVTGVTPSNNGNPWTLMASTQQYYIAKAYFGDYAHLGAFVINKDWMISQYGVLVDSNGTETAAEGNSIKLFGNNIHSGTITVRVSFTASGTATLTATASSESGYDKGRVKTSGGTTLIEVSGTQTNTVNQSVSSGGYIDLSYTKDSSASRNDDMITFTVEGVSYTVSLVSATSGMTWTGSSSSGNSAYTYFDPTDPMASTPPSSGYKFRPNFAVDGKTGKTYQNDAYIKGKVYATDGEFNNGTINNITATNINIKGSTRSPFTFVSDNGTFNDQFTDNMSVRSTTISATTYNIPWDTSQSGKKITITNWKDWNGVESNSEGYAQISAPSGKYFFEDGIQKSKLRLSREAVELIGYGNDDVFFGWAVLKRIDLGTQYRYGHYMKMLAAGTVKVASTDDHTPSFVKKETFDGTTLSVSRLDVGIYKVTWNNNSWFSMSNDVFAMVCGYGTADGVASNGPIYASVKESTTTSITVQVADDDSRNDGGFSFFLLNLGDWIYLHD